MEGACKENAEKMEKDHDQKDIGAPVVNVADQLSEKDILLKMEDRLIGSSRKRLVSEFQQQSCPEQEKNQYQCHAAQSPCQGKVERAFRDLSGSEVKDEAFKEPSVFFTVCHGFPLPVSAIIE